MYIQKEGGRAQKDAMTLREINRLKSNCRAMSGIYALLVVHYLPPWACTLAVPEQQSTHT